MEVGWGGEGGMVGYNGLLASHLSHLTRYHRPQKDILPNVWPKPLSILVVKEAASRNKYIGQVQDLLMNLLNIRHIKLVQIINPLFYQKIILANFSPPKKYILLYIIVFRTNKLCSTDPATFGV